MKPHLSYSALTMLYRCGVQFDYRYNQGIKSPPGVALHIGKAAHASSEADLTSKMQWGELLEEEAVQDEAADAVKRLWKNEPPVRSEGDHDEGGAVDEAVSLARLHHRELAPRIEPVAIEQGFRLEMPDFPFDLVGYVDVEEAGTIRDLKTSSKAPSSTAADESDQLTLYHMNATARGDAPKKVALDYLVKTKTAKVITLESTRTPMDHLRLLARIEAAAKTIQTGSFLPATADSWACSERFCGYWERCKWGSRKSVSVGLVDPSRLTSRLERRPG